MSQVQILSFRPSSAPPDGARFIKFGLVAQLGERCVRNAEVMGSNPTRSTNFIADRTRNVKLFVLPYGFVLVVPAEMLHQESQPPAKPEA